MGEVFLAEDTRLRRRVALKVLPENIAADADRLLRFEREAFAASALNHPNILTIFEFGAEDQTHFLASEFVDGESLRERMSRTTMTVTTTLEIAIQIASALQAAHDAGIIHRDIKPDNVILQPDGGLKLIDLGVARLPHLEDAPAVAAAGTPSYMAPELIAGDDGDERSDLFALGVTIYRMFARAYPYGEVEPFSHPHFTRPVSLTGLRPDLPIWLDQVLARAFAVRREERFEDVLEFIFELEHGADRTRAGPDRRQPLYHRNPLRFWQIVSAILATLLAVALARLARH